MFSCFLEGLFCYLPFECFFGLMGTNLSLLKCTKLLSPLLKGEREKCLVTIIVKVDNINSLLNLLPWANKHTPQLTHKTKHVFLCSVSMERAFPQGS